MAIRGQASAIVGVRANRFSAILSRTALLVCVFGLSIVFACARVYEAPHSALTWLRVCISLVSVGLVVFAKRRNIAQRVLFAFALETVAGLAIFAYVDMPFVTSHDEQIANQVAAGYAKITHRNILSDMRGLTRMH